MIRWQLARSAAGRSAGRSAAQERRRLHVRTAIARDHDARGTSDLAI